jgi:glucan phosphoethanolaminetransferase (alkaline phosphatase superfamily)
VVLNATFRTVLKIAAVLIIIVAAPWGWFEIISRRAVQLYSDDRFNQLARFLAIVVAMFAGIGIAGFLKDNGLRIGLVALFGIGFAIDQIVLEVTGQHTSIELVQIAWSERDLAAQTTGAYANSVAYALIWIVPLFVVLALQPTERTALPKAYALVPLLSLLIAPINIKITSHKIDEYPSTYSVAAQAVYVAFAKGVYAGPRQDVLYDGEPKPLFEKIVFIIDESIRSDYLQINNPQFDNTPFLSSVAGSIANFGTAISATNASVGSRVILRTGVRVDQLPDKEQMALRQPAIWQYAKRAGMRTVYIDAWRPSGEFHSYMNLNELKSIDKHLAVRKGAKPMVDSQVADQIRLELALPGPALIVVEKLGSHIPYSSTVPTDSLYEPLGIDHLPAARDKANRAIVRDYLRSTRNSVDAFFAGLFPAITAPGTLAVYTSDHGQSMFEGGYKASHGSMANAHPGESQVPLLVFSGDAPFNETLQLAARTSHDRASHFDLFPTLLMAMGYDRLWIGRTYGPTLFDIPKNRPRQFLIGNVFGGRKSRLINAD